MMHITQRLVSRKQLMNVIIELFSKKVRHYYWAIQYFDPICGDFPSIFGNITIMEFIFSILGWEKEEY
jgi:hypothetical protein